MENYEKIRYAIVTPARNEEKILNQTIQSVVNQTVKPQKWIILNDGSTDRTGEILKSYSEQHDWIEVINLDKKVSSYQGVQEKMGMAFEKIILDENDFIGKLDADIELGPTYYEDLLLEFKKNPHLGIAGGILFHITNGNRIIEKNPENHVRGGLKFYRNQCWKDIGGMEYKPGYDTIDEIRGAMCGWETKSFTGIKALHHRPTSHFNGLALGEMSYQIGYHPLFIICRSIKYMFFQKPYLLGGISMIVGFFRSYVNGTKRSVNDKKFIKFLRKTQMARLRSLVS